MYSILLMFSLPFIIVREVHEEAKLAREKASDIKMLRQEQAAARREKLKQAYLKKKLEKLKASSKAEQTWPACGKYLLYFLCVNCKYLTAIGGWSVLQMFC